MLARSTPHAVIQSKPGIGDVIWHLPFIRAIAAVSPGGQVTFLAPPTSGARELLVAEPAVAETIYFKHSGSELQRGINLIQLVAPLRRHRFRKIWILDRTMRPALAAFLAGIPERIGVGLTGQRRFITNSGIPQSHFHNFPIECLVKLMADKGVPFATTEPGLRIPSETAGKASAGAVNACGLKLIEATALLAHADLFIGTDSGPLNLAAAARTDAFGFFGGTPVLKYSKYIHPIVPDGGPAPGGMQRILSAQVLEQARPYLSRRKQPA